MKILQESILKTLTYADQFDYPLTKEEIYKWLIIENKNNHQSVGETEVFKQITILVDQKKIEKQLKYYFLKGRKKIVGIRHVREKISEDKWQLAKYTADKLAIIPWVKMVGVTGSLAMKNCKDDDDVDLMIIVSPNSLWLVRLLVQILSNFWNIKLRKARDKLVRNKICLNLYLDQENLKINTQNLSIAHEIVQIVPLINRDQVYESFIFTNRWVRRFLPNSIEIKNNFAEFKSVLNPGSFWLLKIVNQVCFWFQYWYMKPKITNEKINLHQAFFHPVVFNH